MDNASTGSLTVTAMTSAFSVLASSRPVTSAFSARAEPSVAIRMRLYTGDVSLRSDAASIAACWARLLPSVFLARDADGTIDPHQSSLIRPFGFEPEGMHPIRRGPSFHEPSLTNVSTVLNVADPAANRRAAPGKNHGPTCRGDRETGEFGDAFLVRRDRPRQFYLPRPPPGFDLAQRALGLRSAKWQQLSNRVRMIDAVPARDYQGSDGHCHCWTCPWPGVLYDRKHLACGQGVDRRHPSRGRRFAGLDDPEGPGWAPWCRCRRLRFHVRRPAARRTARRRRCCRDVCRRKHAGRLCHGARRARSQVLGRSRASNGSPLGCRFD